MKLIIAIVLGCVFLDFTQAVYAVSNGHDTAIAPFKETYVVDINESEELFENSPAYSLDNPRQILFHNGWQGNEDYAFRLRFFWSSSSIFLRFDITDDIYIVSTNTELENSNGDYIRVDLAHLTSGPDRNSVEPWSLLLLPDVQNESCNLILNTNSAIKKSKIGKIECALLRTIDGYSMIIKLPYEKWDDRPRRGGMTRLHVVYGDSDSSGNIDHKFVLFPINQDMNNEPTKSIQMGNIRYAERTWLTTYPRDIVNSRHRATLLMDVGNITDRALDVVIHPEKAKSKTPIESPSEENRVTYRVPAGTAKQRVSVDLNFKGLPSGTYTINGKSGVFYDSGAFVVKYSSKSGLIYCPNLIERREKTFVRNLSVTNSPELTNRTFQHLAGGGKVLWSAGLYDASSLDFPQYIRKIGEHEITVPEAGNKQVPWAIFGGLDNLDGMNEPLVLTFDSELDRSQEQFTPDEPLIQSKKNPPRSLRKKFKFLLLFGVVVEHSDKGSFPEIHIFTDSKTLLRQRLQPSSTGVPKKRHSYILRVWLSSLDSAVKVVNSATHAPRVEIDFIALLGGTKEHQNESDDSSIRFAGNDVADIFTKQIATSKFLLENYMVDTDGRAYSSLPGGRNIGVNLRDWALLTSELVAWGALDQASALAQKFPLILETAERTEALGGFTIGHALTVTSIYNTWRKLGKNKSFLDPIWLSCVHRPLTELAREAETNPLRLVNTVGEFGVDDKQNSGATLPMYFALQSAIASGITMAKQSGYSENAVSWNSASDRLALGFRRHLVSGESQVQLVSQKVFPGGWGIEEQQGVVLSLPTDVWVYGRYLDERPVLYNDTIRVFDTPYLLSGVPFLFDYFGFNLTDDTLDQLKASFDFVLAFSPIYRKPLWSKFYMVDYNKSVLQLWTAMAGLLLDSLPLASNTLTNYIRYSFDEFVSIPESSDIEVSPYTFEEKLGVSADGENTGAIHDDLNIMNGTTALKTTRLIAGIDDSDSSTLHLTPRLPEEWKGLEAKKWLINNDLAESGTSRIEYSYERLSRGSYAMTVESTDKLNAIMVRMGPFSPKTRKVRISGEAVPADVPTFRHGFYSWAVRTFKKAKSLEIIAQEIVY